MIINNAIIVTWGIPNQIIPFGSIVIKDGKIVDYGPKIDEKYLPKNEEIVDAGGQFVMPGNICTHTHFYGAFAKGMATMGTPAQDFVDNLRSMSHVLAAVAERQLIGAG